MRLCLSARKRISLICTHKPDARLPECKGEFTTCGYSFTTSFVQISIAGIKDIMMNNTWFLSLRYSWFSGRDKVGHRSLQCYDLKIENRELTAGSLPSHDALSGQPGRRPPGLDYCLFPCLMKGSHLWWNSLCEVYSHRTTKEKSLSCSLAASSAKPYARHSVGSHKPQDSCSFRPTVNVLGIKGTSEQG